MFQLDNTPTPANFLVTTLMVLVGFYLLKLLDDKFPIPGVHDVITTVIN